MARKTSKAPRKRRSQDWCLHPANSSRLLQAPNCHLDYVDPSCNTTKQHQLSRLTIINYSDRASCELVEKGYDSPDSDNGDRIVQIVAKSSRSAAACDNTANCHEFDRLKLANLNDSLMIATLTSFPQETRHREEKRRRPRLPTKTNMKVATSTKRKSEVNAEMRLIARLALLLSIFLQVLTLISCQISTRSADNQAFGCPYPGVGSNCQVNIVAQAPAVPLLSTEFVADEYATLKSDTQASYKCDKGFELLGQETITCLPSGRWSASPPSCVTNIALGKPTNQSSTVKGGDSRNANDGKPITQHDSKYCTETRVDQSPWWQIDLLQLYEIRSVRLLGRACCNAQLSLHDIEIRVGNSSTLQGNRLCAWYPNNLDEGVARDFQCAYPIIGRFVSIQMVGIEAALSLCEVMVFSTKEFPSDRCSVQETLAPASKQLSSATSPSTVAATTTTSASTTTSQVSTNGNGLSSTGTGDNQQLLVFNRTCYEMQTTNGGSYLVADTYCKARGGTLMHSVNNLTHSFITQELERARSKLKTKLVWLGARRENSSPNALGPITPGSTSALIGNESPTLAGRSLMASLNEFPIESLFSGDRGNAFSSGEASPLFSPTSMARTSLYQVSSGAGGSTSRGSQTFGLSTSGQAPQPVFNRSTETHPQRSLIVSQPNQVASFFTPPVPISSGSATGSQLPQSNQQQQQQPILPQPSPSSLISFSSQASHAHRSLRPPSLVTTSQPPHASSSLSSSSSSSSSQQNWAFSNGGSLNNLPANVASAAAANLLLSPKPQSQSANTGWRWVGDSQSDTVLSPISSFMWADDQPNNYNNQQDCMVLDGGRKWLWNDVTCELDYLPWVCQYRPSTCGSPDRHENSTILESLSMPDGAATNGVTAQEPIYQFGKTINYACPVGHRLEGNRQRKCQYDGTWSGKAPKCQYVNCGSVSSQPIENGYVVYLNQSQTTYGSQVKFVCYEDYVLVGNDVRQCQSDGRWGGKLPYCAYKWCPQLPQIANGFLNVSTFTENSIASYQCNPGYKLIGNDTRQCLLGGKWTNQEPFCQYVECGQPKQIANGNYQLVNATTNYLSVALYNCNENYTLVDTNNKKMICSHNNRWTGKEPQCSLIDCGQPQANSGSSFSGESFSVHSTIVYKCDPGFKEVSGNTERTCGLDGKWTGQPITCKYVDCGRVPAILKGEVSYINGTTYLASQVTYECTPGNRLSGHRVRFCGPDARWTGTSPKCEEVRCDAPELPTNGSAIYIGNDRSFKEQSFSVGVTVQYECDYGHVVRGSWASRLCQANGEWSGEPPVCKFVDCGTPPTIENGNYVLKHPPVGSVGSATALTESSTRRSDTLSSSLASTLPLSSSSLLSSSSAASSSSLSSGAGQIGSFTYYGTIAHYNCDANFKMQGPPQRECLDSGQWRTPLPTCEPVQCPKPEFFDEFTQVSLVNRANQPPQTGGSATVQEIHQHNSGNPSSGEHSMQLAALRSIKIIANNQWINHDSSQSYGVGDKLYYSCVPGYELYGGPEVRTCTQYGQWSGSSTPRCRLIDCGRPSPIGQEGRFYLLNESTTFNSLVEYSCVRPFKLVETKIRQPGNLIETLKIAQAGLTPILTSLPIGVKVCANNGQWMPNDQQPKCVSASDASGTSNGGQFDGVDNTLDGSQRIQVLAGATGQTTTFIGNGASGGASGSNNNQDDQSDNNLDLAGHHQQPRQKAGSSNGGNSSFWAKVIIAICLLVMLALIILTLICIRTGKNKPKQTHRASILTDHGQHPAVAAAAMQIQLANGKGMQPQHHQQHQNHQQAASMLSSQNVYINGPAHKMYAQQAGVGGAQMMAASQNQMAAAVAAHQQNRISQSMIPYGEAGAATALTSLHQQGFMLANGDRPAIVVGANGSELIMNGRSSSLAILGSRQQQVGSGAGQHHHHQASSANSTSSMLDSYTRLTIESDQTASNTANKTIRHNPNGLVTFVSPVQQQQNRNTAQQQQQSGPSSQHQVSPQSISTSLSMSSSSSPSSSSSAHHTTATRLSTTDSASSSSSTSNGNGSSNNNNNNSNIKQNGASGYQTSPQPYPQAPLPSPPSLPAHPPPSHRLQQHQKQTTKQQQLQNGGSRQQTEQSSNSNNNNNQQKSSSQQQKQSADNHYMEPNI